MSMSDKGSLSLQIMPITVKPNLSLSTTLEIPLQTVEKTLVMKAVPLQSMEDDMGADKHIRGPHTGTIIYSLKEAAAPPFPNPFTIWCVRRGRRVMI